MHIVMIGDYNKRVKEKIAATFPQEWKLNIIPYSDIPNYNLESVDVLIPGHYSVDRELLTKTKNLKLIQTGAGYDNIDLNLCNEFGVVVANAAGVNANAVAEYTMALLLAYSKNIIVFDTSMKLGINENNYEYQGGELEGKSIGIVGFGAIGKKVARLCKAFGMHVLVHTRTIPTDNIDGYTFVDFETLLKESDIISIHTPLTKDTYHMFNEDAFDKMKSDSLLINTSRGSVVDEKALIKVLKNQEIQGACLDVFEVEPLPMDSELRQLSNVVLSPHASGMPDSFRYHKKRYDFYIHNIRNIEAHKLPDNILNKPI